jgi:hypothetical protein
MVNKSFILLEDEIRNVKSNFDVTMAQSNHKLSEESISNLNYYVETSIKENRQKLMRELIAAMQSVMELEVALAKLNKNITNPANDPSNAHFRYAGKMNAAFAGLNNAKQLRDLKATDYKNKSSAVLKSGEALADKLIKGLFTSVVSYSGATKEIQALTRAVNATADTVANLSTKNISNMLNETKKIGKDAKWNSFKRTLAVFVPAAIGFAFAIAISPILLFLDFTFFTQPQYANLNFTQAATFSVFKFAAHLAGGYQKKQAAIVNTMKDFTNLSESAEKLKSSLPEEILDEPQQKRGAPLAYNPKFYPAELQNEMEISSEEDPVKAGRNKRSSSVSWVSSNKQQVGEIDHPEVRKEGEPVHRLKK